MTTKFSPRAALRRIFTSLAAIAAVCVIFASKAVEHETATPSHVASVIVSN